MKETNTSWIISTIRDNKTLHQLKDKLTAFFGFGLSRRPPIVTEQSTLRELATHYQGIWDLLEKKYHLPKSKLSLNSSLSSLSSQFDLPPAQIIFMEIQLQQNAHRVEELTALEAQKLMQGNDAVVVLDVRESWEREFGSLPNSKPLDEPLLKEMLTSWSKNTPLLLYCHFGVRSSDAAHHLSQNGFFNLYTIKGGIDAWSNQVDPALPRYSGSYC